MNQSEIKKSSKLFTEIYSSLQNESERGCVLVVGALLDKILKDQIVARLLPPKGKKGEDELIGESRFSPIGSSSARIDLAYRIGLITSDERDIYHQLRHLRNDCAHEIEEQKFDAAKFKDRIMNSPYAVEKNLITV